jgi:hypothetical protein
MFMSLPDLASLGSFVSGVAVLGSLIFLYLQMRQIGAQIEQAARNQRAAIRAERTSRVTTVLMAMVEPSAADALFLGNAASEEMSVTQVRQYFMYCLSRFMNAEDAYSQHAEGLLGDSAFNSMVAAFRTALSAPGFRVAWQLQKVQFDGDFVVFVDRLLAETPMVIPTETAVRFKAAFAAEKAKAVA